MTRQPLAPTSSLLAASSQEAVRFRPSMPVPWTVRATFWAIIANCVLIVMTSLHGLLTTDWAAWVASQVHFYVRNGRQLEVTPEIAVGTIVFRGVVIALLVAFHVFLAFRVLRGYRWARVVFTLLTLAVLAGLATDDVIRTFAATGWLQAVLALAADFAYAVCAVLIWLPVSNAFVRTATAERRAFTESLLHTR